MSKIRTKILLAIVLFAGSSAAGQYSYGASEYTNQACEVVEAFVAGRAAFPPDPEIKFIGSYLDPEPTWLRMHHIPRDQEGPDSTIAYLNSRIEHIEKKSKIDNPERVYNAFKSAQSQSFSINDCQLPNPELISEKSHQRLANALDNYRKRTQQYFAKVEEMAAKWADSGQPFDVYTRLTENIQAPPQIRYSWDVISRIGITPENDLAIFYYSHACSNVCGGASFVIMKREDGIWKTAETHLLAIY